MNFVPTSGSLWPPANIMQIQVNFDAMTTQGKHCQQLVGNEEIQNHPISEIHIFGYFGCALSLQSFLVYAAYYACCICAWGGFKKIQDRSKK